MKKVVATSTQPFYLEWFIIILVVAIYVNREAATRLADDRAHKDAFLYCLGVDTTRLLAQLFFLEGERNR